MQNNIKDFFLSLNCDVKFDSPASKITTFKTGGNVDITVTPHDELTIKKITGFAKENNIPVTLLGNGSNVLISDNGIKGIVLKMADSLTDIKCNGIEISVGAGVSLTKLCNFALENSLTGLEFAYGIPGSVGGAICMNAGAYGGEIKSVLKTATHIDKNDNTVTMKNDELSLSYRHTYYTENTDCIITEAVFSLTKGNKDDIRNKMNELIAKRKDKQPLEYPSAGSTFKRPEGNFAGALIEQSGLKGFSHGGAKVSEKHAGFIINYDNATSTDILELIKEVQNIVFEKTGIMLEPEVKML